MKEQRRFIRFDIGVKVNYIVQKEPMVEKTGTMEDVNAGGLRLLTGEKLETGSKLELKIFIPGAANPVHMKGSVLWLKDVPAQKGMSYSTGIEFGEIEEDNKNTFLKFLCDLMYRKIGRQPE